MRDDGETKYGPQNIDPPAKRRVTLRMTQTAQAKLERAPNTNRPGVRASDRFYTARDIRELLMNNAGTLFRNVEEEYYHFLTTHSRIVWLVEDGADLVVVTQMHRHGLHYRIERGFELVKAIPWQFTDSASDTGGRTDES